MTPPTALLANEWPLAFFLAVAAVALVAIVAIVAFAILRSQQNQSRKPDDDEPDVLPFRREPRE